MKPLSWLLLEAGTALALLVPIAWWTWPRKESGEDPESHDPRQRHAAIS
jgi:hypothetical protein